jgi:hypothetical protein
MSTTFTTTIIITNNARLLVYLAGCFVSSFLGPLSP